MINEFIVEYKATITKTIKRSVVFKTELDIDELIGRLDLLAEKIKKDLERRKNNVTEGPIVMRFYPRHQAKKKKPSRKSIDRLEKLVSK